MIRVLTAAGAFLVAAPAIAADPEYCALWGREFVRIEVDHIGSGKLSRRSKNGRRT